MDAVGDMKVANDKNQDHGEGGEVNTEVVNCFAMRLRRDAREGSSHVARRRGRLCYLDRIVSW